MIFVPVGPPGAGKTTAGTQLVNDGILEQEGLVSVEYMRFWLTGDASRRRVSEATEICYQIVEARYCYGQSSYLDATNISDTAIKRLRSMAPVDDVLFILFDVPLKVCFRRNAGRIDPVPDAAIHRMFTAYKKTEAKLLSVNAHCVFMSKMGEYVLEREKTKA